MRLTKEAGDCEDGPCPAIYAVDGDPAVTAFQGYFAPEVENVAPPPPGEGMWLMPTDLVLRWAARRLGVDAP
jgi:hypothetical protein